MKKMMKVLPSIIFTAIIFTRFTFAAVDQIDGIRYLEVTNSIDYCGIQPTRDALTKVIRNRIRVKHPNFDITTESNINYVDTLIDNLEGVSKCFDIDPLVFAALIGHESYFDNEINSHTNAIGLGQLTTVALKEVSMQLHAPTTAKSDRGRFEALRHWQEAISCIEQELPNSSLAKNWWEYSSRTEWKKELHDNITLNLTYSAIIFKVAYARAYNFYKNNSAKDATLSQMIEKHMGYYNSASTEEQLKHYTGTRIIMNQILTKMSMTDNKCYKGK